MGWESRIENYKDSQLTGFKSEDWKKKSKLGLRPAISISKTQFTDYRPLTTGLLTDSNDQAPGQGNALPAPFAFCILRSELNEAN